jgi:hypothetical protein
MRSLRAAAVCLLLAPAGAQDAARSVAVSDRVQFNRDVRPILSDACMACHGPDLKARKADLRLDRKEGLFGEYEKGKSAVVPGSLDKSELWKRVSTSDSSDVMPPKKSGKKLKPGQIDILRRWIEQGAAWQGHWAFEPLPVAAAAPPSIDAFIQARLRAEGLSPSPEADKAALLRRVTLDLTGLPPEPGDVDAFLADASPTAYEKAVDRLLASPHYGEHMARYWLDLARYGDTHGLHLDNYREMWPWRDWVIGAFNENMPFDRFVTEQLAGDLLPAATLEQQIATGFNRNHITTSEGGSIEEEVHVRNVMDRVDTFGQVFFGITLGCSKCHDHKFDPFTMKDYYQLTAFFNSCDGPDLDGNRKDTPPVLKVPTVAERAELARLGDRAKELEGRLNGLVPELDAPQADWEKDLAARFPKLWTKLDPADLKSFGASLKEDPDHVVVAAAPRIVYEVDVPIPDGARAFKLQVVAPPGEGPSPFTLSSVEVVEGDAVIKIVNAVGSDAAVRALVDGKAETSWAGDARTSPFAVLVPARAPAGPACKLRLIHEGDAAKAPLQRFAISAARDAELLRGVTPVTLSAWKQIGPFAAAGAAEAFKSAHEVETGADAPWVDKDYADGKPHEFDETVGSTYLLRTLTSPMARKVVLQLSHKDAMKAWLNGRHIYAHEAPKRIGDVEKVSVSLAPGENRLLLKVVNYAGKGGFKFQLTDEDAGDLFKALEDALAAPADKRTEAQAAALRKSFRRDHWPEWKPLSADLEDVRAAEKKILDAAPTTLVFKERATPRDAYILDRGEYDRRKDKVAREVPGTLPPMAPELPRNRLGLAKWLLDPSHPLTARVTVNRFWQQCFGVGLAKTAGDVGLQGEPPSHPELLDALAADFISSGWDLKRFMKRLVMSTTYRQSSRTTADLVRRDPENRLLARGPRFRLDAEMLRDQALAAGGLLVRTIGGPSVKPPQPAGLWEAVGYTSSNTARFARDPEPEKAFRRSMYIFWKRTSPPPQMTSFDAPSRENCLARRERTNTPLQALVLMNEPQNVEAARHLAQRALREGGPDPAARATLMMRRVLGRGPSKKDLADLTTAYAAFREAYAAKPDEAKKLISLGDLKPEPSFDPVELAAWTMVGQVILNLDAVLTKE